MNATHEAKLNQLFLDLEEVTNEAKRHARAVVSGDDFSRKVYDGLHSDALAEVHDIEKRIVRLFFRSGCPNDLLCHIEAGTFGRFIIQATLHRDLRAIPNRFVHRSIWDTLPTNNKGFKAI